MISILDEETVVANAARELLSHAWSVIGHRYLEDGTEQCLTASAWGATEERARAFYERLQDLQYEQRRQGGYRVDPRWEQSQLTFQRVEESA